MPSRVIICVSHKMVMDGSPLVHGAEFTHVCSHCGDAVATAPAIRRFIGKLTAQGDTYETRCVRCFSPEELEEALQDAEILPEVMAEVIAYLKRN